MEPAVQGAALSGAAGGARPETDRRDAVFVPVMFLCCFAFCDWILFGGLGVAVPLCYAVFYAAVLVYLGRGRLHCTRAAAVTFVPVALLLACFALYDNEFLRLLNVPALWGFTALHVSALAGIDARPSGPAGAAADILRFTFRNPFHHIGASPRALYGRGGGARRRVLTVLAALLVVSPLALIVLALLASSDAGFERLMNAAAGYFSDRIAEAVFKILAAALLTFPAFSLLFTLRHDGRPEKPAASALPAGRLEALAASSALGTFSVIYAVYVGLQADYFFSALRGCLPAGFTPAQYARRGFFELAGVVFINFCLIALAAAVTRRHKGRLPAGCRFSILALCVFTLLLVVTAGAKMTLYMRQFGLTPMRVYASFFILVLGVTTLLAAANMIFPAFSFWRWAAAAAVVLYLALNLADTDALIANWNIRLARETGRPLDTSVLRSLSDSAVPQTAELLGDGRWSAEIGPYLRQRSETLQRQPWQSRSLASWRAGQALQGR